MSDQSKKYIETRDIYLELLQSAQKHKDQKLINMIREKLKQYSPSSFITEDGCEVIYFPCINTPFSEPEQELQFWRKPDFWPDLIQFVGMVTFSFTAIVYLLVRGVI